MGDRDTSHGQKTLLISTFDVAQQGGVSRPSRAVRCSNERSFPWFFLCLVSAKRDGRHVRDTDTDRRSSLFDFLIGCGYIKSTNGSRLILAVKQLISRQHGVIANVNFAQTGFHKGRSA